MSDQKRLTSLLYDYLSRGIAGTLPGGSLTVGSPNKIGHGKKTILVSNTPEPLSNLGIAVKDVWMQTPKTNGNVYVGDENVNTDSCKIEKNSNGFLEVSDLRNLYVYGISGDVIYYVYTYNG